MGGPESGGVAGHSHHSLATCDSQRRVGCANAPVIEHHCSLNYNGHQGRAGLAKSAGHGHHFVNR